MENKRGKNDKMLEGMWEEVEDKADKAGMAKEERKEIEEEKEEDTKRKGK